MIELFSKNEYVNARQSSKGNQLKWEYDNVWYKADYVGYEGLAEYMVSHLLQRSSLNEEEYVLYDLETITYKDNLYNGCRSNGFLKEGETLVTLERLFREKYNQSLYKSVYQIQGIEERIDFIVNSVINITNLEEFKTYFLKIITIDAIFLNEDRHTHNIAVIRKNDGKYRLCPIFDNGACLLSDTMFDYPMGKDTYKLIENVQSKTVSWDFLEQLEACESLYGTKMSFQWNRNDVIELLKNVNTYSEKVKTRVYDILLEQRKKYTYLFE